MSRPHPRRAAVVAGAVVAIAGTAAPGVHRAAADPPGYPSTGRVDPTPQSPKPASNAAAPTGSASTPVGKPTPNAPKAQSAAADPKGFPSKGAAAQTTQTTQTTQTAAEQTEAFLREKTAALRKFSHDKESDPAFREHEGPDRACRIDRDHQVVTLTFNADGTLHCKLAELAEGYEIDVWVLTVKDLYDTGNHYRVTVTTGAALSFAPIHGTSTDVKAELAVLAGLHADVTEAAWWHAPRRYGPYHFDSATITVSLDECAASQDTKLTIVPLYRFAVTVLAIAGPGVPGYAVADGKISQSQNRADLAYYFGVHFYPLSWHRDGKRNTLPGRYFSDEYSEWYDRISLLAGVDLGHPTEAGYLGAAVEVYGGVAITVGWQPRKHRRLHTGYAVGDALVGDQVPTDEAWKLGSWAAGISIDAALLKTLLGYIGR